MFSRIAPEALFPSTIWIHDLKPEIAGPLNQRLVAELDRLISPKPPRAPGETWQTESTLHERAAFKELTAIFLTASRGVLDQIDIE